MSGNLEREGSEAGLPVDGYLPATTPTPLLDALSDADLAALNTLLPWHCFTVDSRGRRFGNRAWTGKREKPQAIPDRRIVLCHERFDLADKHVLEIGCFEGVHTLGLGLFARQVTAIDSRIENVAKTLVRCHFHGQKPAVAVCDVESRDDMARLPQVDVVHHVGVLYHLVDPVSHLKMLASKVRLGMMLDTHVAPADSTATYEVDGASYAHEVHQEGGAAEVFSGMYPSARWLTVEALVQALQTAGFADVELYQTRQERNGERVLMFARRTVSV